MADQTPAQAPKAQILSFPFRRTGMGGFDDVAILSFRTKRPVKSILRTSRSGNHGKRLYRLFPGKYILYKVWRSNSGNLYCNISIIRITEEGQEIEKEWEIVRGKEQKLQLTDLPKNIQEILAANKEELPLFRSVFLLNVEEE